MEKKFDKKLDELESIVEKIENKETGLEESMKLFEKGIVIARECLDFLEESKGRIEDMTEKLDSLISAEREDKDKYDSEIDR